jgi:hypothetical protein
VACRDWDNGFPKVANLFIGFEPESWKNFSSNEGAE